MFLEKFKIFPTVLGICGWNCYAAILIDDDEVAINSLVAVTKVLALLDAQIDLRDSVAAELNNLPPELDLIYAGLMALDNIIILFPHYFTLQTPYLATPDCMKDLVLTNKLYSNFLVFSLLIISNILLLYYLN